MISITGEQFELINGWDFADAGTKELIRDAGWALRNTGGAIDEEWMNITSLGVFNNSTTDRAYYLQSLGGVPTNIVLAGEVNQAIKVYGSATYGNFDFKGFFKIYLREEGKSYGFYDLNSEQNVAQLTYRKYTLPLVNSLDLKVSVVDTDIDANSDSIADVAPYTGMSISYFSTPQVRSIGGTNYNFNVIIDGNNGTAEQIYEFVQWSLRQPADIDAEATVVRGDTAQDLLQFIGDTLRTKAIATGGVYIDNFQPADTNRLEFTDNTSAVITFPYVAAGSIIFNENLQNDADAKYFVFFTNDDAGDNLGADFGTSDAIIIQDNSAAPITGLVGGAPIVQFDYDYDNNGQRGTGSEGTNAPFTAVALGLTTAQYVATTGTLVRATSNIINLVSSLERNYVG